MRLVAAISALFTFAIIDFGAIAASSRAFDHIEPLDPSAHIGKSTPVPKDVLVGDRLEYDSDDLSGQFFASFAAPAAPGASLVLRLMADTGSKRIDEARHPADQRAQF